MKDSYEPTMGDAHLRGSTQDFTQGLQGGQYRMAQMLQNQRNQSGSKDDTKLTKDYGVGTYLEKAFPSLFHQRGSGISIGSEFNLGKGNKGTTNTEKGGELIGKESFEGGSGAFTKGAGSGAKTFGGMTTNQWINTAGGALSSYMSAAEQAKVAKDAAKSKPYERYRTPYGNEYIRQLIPYILGSQQQVFANRMRGYGLNPQDFSSYQAALAGVPSTYSGVGR